MIYYSKLFIWAIKLHISKWSRYRFDVIIWIVSIWFTLLVQAYFIYLTYVLGGNQLFGYTPKELFVFLGITLLGTGIAQTLAHGLILHFARAIWTGHFDYWLIQPSNILFRMLVEDLGLIWFFGHICAGMIILISLLNSTQLILGFTVSLIAALFEVGMTLIICLPALYWPRWNPNEGLWEYLENSRSVPIIRANNWVLYLISFGVIQYSVALEVFANPSSLPWFLCVTILIWVLALIMAKKMIASYTSASS